MGRADAPVHAPPGISGTCRKAGVHPQTREAREASDWRAMCGRPGAHVLSAIYEEDFLPCSFGGRPGQGAHHALATLTGKVSWVLEADLKNFFGSLNHDWLLRFVEHRVGDPRLLSLMRRWLKAGALEDGVHQPSEEGTPQGGSISVLLSNVYLHYVLDLWFESVVKPRLQGEA